MTRPLLLTFCGNPRAARRATPGTPSGAGRTGRPAARPAPFSPREWRTETRHATPCPFRHPADVPELTDPQISRYRANPLRPTSSATSAISGSRRVESPPSPSKRWVIEAKGSPMQWVFLVLALLAALAELHTGTFYLAGVAAAALLTALMGFWIRGDLLIFAFVALCAILTAAVMLSWRHQARTKSSHGFRHRPDRDDT